MPILSAGEVHVWTAQSTSDANVVAALERLLSPSEQAAANRFYFERHRLRYVFAHGVLRQILSRYVDRAPEEIRFAQNAYGKPFLVDLDDRGHTHFNMSHSGDAVLVALTRGRHIGADVERIRPLYDFAGIAKYNFTPQECVFIKSFSAEMQPNAFFTCWTRKEAFIKAVGKGLSIPLNTFDVSIPPGQPGLKLAAPKESPGIDAWWLADLTAPEGYAGAVAVEQGFDRLVYTAWRPL